LVNQSFRISFGDISPFSPCSPDANHNRRWVEFDLDDVQIVLVVWFPRAFAGWAFTTKHDVREKNDVYALAWSLAFGL